METEKKSKNYKDIFSIVLLWCYPYHGWKAEISANNNNNIDSFFIIVWYSFEKQNNKEII